MTIVTSVKVKDGLVLGADSVTTISVASGKSKGAVLKTYANAQKLFRIDSLPIGIMTWGLGSIGGRSAEGIVKDFQESLPEGTADVEEVAEALAAYVGPLYAEAFPGGKGEPLTQAGFIVAGYSDGAQMAETFEVVLPRDTAAQSLQSEAQIGALWRGITDPYSAVALGMTSQVMQELTKRGATKQQIQSLMNRAGMSVIFDGMPLQDAVNYAVYILEVTIGWAAFQQGERSCGHPLQVACLRPGHWEWVAQPSLTLPAR